MWYVNAIATTTGTKIGNFGTKTSANMLLSLAFALTDFGSSVTVDAQLHAKSLEQKTKCVRRSSHKCWPTAEHA